MIDQHSKVIIFSVERSGLTIYENYSRNMEILNLLNFCNIPHKLLTGYWRGTKETSFLVEAVHQAFLGPTLFSKYDQDCYLLLDIDREAFFITKHATVRAGYFQETEKLIAIKCGNYTFDPATDRYYITQ